MPTKIANLDEFKQILKEGDRLLGLDVGAKTIGLALSDVNRRVATPLDTLMRTKFKADAERLIRIAGKHQAGALIIGLPLNMDGSEGPRAQSVRAFARNLRPLTPLPIVFWDERLSTAAAERAMLEADLSRKRRGEIVDKLAAAFILQSALDRMNFER